MIIELRTNVFIFYVENPGKLLPNFIGEMFSEKSKKLFILSLKEITNEKNILCVIFVIISREKHMIFLLIMGMVQSDPSNSKLGRMAQLYFLQNRKKV